MRRTQKRWSRWLVGGSLCCVIGLLSLPALALGSEFESKLEFGKEGSGEGQLKKPSGVAVDNNGNVWVADTANNRIEEFSSTGTFIKAWGKEGAGTAEGQFKEPTGIAFSNVRSGSFGPYLFVADKGNKRIVPIEIHGSELRGWGNGWPTNGATSAAPTGIAASSEGEVLVTMANDEIAKYIWYPEPEVAKFEKIWTFGAAGSETGQFKEPTGLAIVPVKSSVSDVYVADTGNNRVQVLTDPGALEKPKYVSQLNKNTQVYKPTGVAVEPEGLESLGNDVLVAGVSYTPLSSGAWGQFGGASEEYKLLHKYEKEKGMETSGIAITGDDAYIVNPAKDSVTKWVFP